MCGMGQATLLVVGERHFGKAAMTSDKSGPAVVASVINKA